MNGPQTSFNNPLGANNDVVPVLVFGSIISVRCFKQIWKVGKVGKKGKVGTVGTVGKEGRLHE